MVATPESETLKSLNIYGLVGQSLLSGFLTILIWRHFNYYILYKQKYDSQRLISQTHIVKILELQKVQSESIRPTYPTWAQKKNSQVL